MPWIFPWLEACEAASRHMFPATAEMYKRCLDMHACMIFLTSALLPELQASCQFAASTWRTRLDDGTLGHSGTSNVTREWEYLAPRVGVVTSTYRGIDSFHYFIDTDEFILQDAIRISMAHPWVRLPMDWPGG